MPSTKRTSDAAFDSGIDILSRGLPPIRPVKDMRRQPSGESQLEQLAQPERPSPSVSGSQAVKRFVSQKVDRMASQFVSSYNKRRPIHDFIKAKAIDIASMQKARSYEWIGEPVSVVETTEVRREYFESLLLDGVKVKVGDGLKIIDRHGEEHLTVLSKLYHRFDPAVPTDKGSPRAHVEYLEEHKYGWPGELFVKHGSCRTIQLSQVRGRFELAAERPDFAAPSVFCSLAHVAATDTYHERRAGCSTCDSNAPRLSVPAVQAHLHDEIAIDTGESHCVFKIGRVIDVQEGSGTVEVQWFGRMSDLADGPYFADPWSLYLTEITAVVDTADIKQVVLVRSQEPESYTDHPADIFHCRHRLPAGRLTSRRSLVALDTLLSCCISCTSAILNREEDLKAFRAMGGLPSADLYAGGGGTMVGKKGWFASKLAVDLDPTACATLELNFPDTTVVCHKIDRLHFAALQRDQRGSHQRIIDQRDAAGTGDKAREVHAFPQKGAFALLSASPPCQGFSGKNRFRKADDPRNEEVIFVLSEVDRSKPDWVVIENVLGMTHGRADGALMDTGVDSFADMVNKMLIGLGYQVLTVKADAASYGSPSSRPRIFFVAARQGLPLPRFPLPTHTNRRFQAPGMTEASRHMFRRSAGSALLPGVTARDAISDLAPFDFPIPGLSSRKALPTGFTHSIPFATAPRTVYQAVKRSEAEKAVGHCTPLPSANQLDIIKSVVQAGPEGFQVPKDAEGGRTDSPYRVSPDAPFKTLLTSPSGACIHWEQHRFLTVAERARAQGFPDEYRLAGNVVEQNKQIGNAVNPDIASAIFRQIVLDAVLPVWLQMGRPGANDFARRWREKYPV